MSSRGEDDEDKSQKHYANHETKEPARERGPGFLGRFAGVLFQFVAVTLPSQLVVLPFRVAVHVRPPGKW
jgi:hypothetical protein